MFTLKCSKASGVMHVYEASGYTIKPPQKNESGEIVTTIESWAPDGKSIPVHHVCLDSEILYREIFIENAHGKTIDVIRGSQAARDTGDRNVHTKMFKSKRRDARQQETK